MSRKLPIAAGVLLLLAGTIAVVWSGLAFVPIRFLWRYGPTPACRPTGEVIAIGDIEFVVIGPGCFRMGSNRLGKPGSAVGRAVRPLGIEWGEPVDPSPEMPVHWCEFPRAFALARTELTNAQFERYAPDHERSRHSPDDEAPVTEVSWEEASAYCRWLSQESGRTVRLPAESEWEACARAGTSTAYFGGDDASALAEYAWHPGNAGAQAHAVGTKAANAWGFFDLHGNAAEWCEDEWHGSYRLATTRALADGTTRTAFVDAPTDGSAWEDAGASRRVCRGGAFCYPASDHRSACRYLNTATRRIVGLGFRPALTLPPDR